MTQTMSPNGDTAPEPLDVQAMDAYFNRLLRQGGMRVVTGRDADGNTIIETVDLSAAMLNAMRARAKDLGLQSPMKVGTPSGDLMSRAMERMGQGLSLPEIDAESDDAATSCA